MAETAKVKPRQPGGQRQRGASGMGAWERVTNKQQRKLVRIYDSWSAKVRKAMRSVAKAGGSVVEQNAVFEKGLAELEGNMEKGVSDGLRSAARASAKSRITAPAVEATIQKHLAENAKHIKEGFIPTISKRLLPDIARGLAGDKKAIQEAFLAVRSAPGQYAGSSWVMIFDVQKTLGQAKALAQISEGKKPEPVRWVLDPAAEHCLASAGMYGCLELKGEYDNWDALPTIPAGTVTCRGNCRCHLEVFRDGQWQRGVYGD